jgi:hypothetical protein
MGDKAEKKLYELVEQGDLRAVSFYLSCCHKDRGYGSSPGTTLNTGDTTNVMVIGSVHIETIPTEEGTAGVRGATTGATAPPRRRQAPDTPC